MFWRFSFCSWFGVFPSVRRIDVFLELVFTPMATTKRNAVPVQTGLSSFDLRRKRTESSQSTCIQDDLRFRSFTIARLS